MNMCVHVRMRAYVYMHKSSYPHWLSHDMFQILHFAPLSGGDAVRWGGVCIWRCECDCARTYTHTSNYLMDSVTTCFRYFILRHSAAVMLSGEAACAFTSARSFSCTCGCLATCRSVNSIAVAVCSIHYYQEREIKKGREKWQMNASSRY